MPPKKQRGGLFDPMSGNLNLLTAKSVNVLGSDTVYNGNYMNVSGGKKTAKAKAKPVKKPVNTPNQSKSADKKHNKK